MEPSAQKLGASAPPVDSHKSSTERAFKMEAVSTDMLS